jgi:hypothetical protein
VFKLHTGEECDALTQETRSLQKSVVDYEMRLGITPTFVLDESESEDDKEEEKKK